MPTIPEASHPPMQFTTNIVQQDAKEILRRDRMRAKTLLAEHQPHGPLAFYKKAGTQPAKVKSIAVTDAAVTYTCKVDIGSPATSYELLIDTGSSNTWVGSGKEYVTSKTSHNTREAFQISYGSGSCSGTQYIDQVSLGEGLVIPKQAIGVATKADGMNGIDGILGIGPVDLTQGTVQFGERVPTVTDNLYKNKTIPTESIGIFYQPTTSADPVPNGELTFGGIDASKCEGEMTWVPITKTSPANKYWGIDQTVTYGDGATLMKNCAGIVDTGTTLLMISTDAFNAYKKATGAKLDENTGLLTVTEEQFKNMQSMMFHIGETPFEFTANAQRWPSQLGTMMGGKEGQIYLIVADMGELSGKGMDFINGFGWLQRFYSVYDTTNGRVGIANTKYTKAESN
ncbi:aspartic peptidase domain-containing protein [Schizophyllum amplum]|uniref:Aspartic peptidase domain-containing protein n=1 Tax=Schizophyllum amplum TaxID=97359 RepID=A0A550C773_9AGAR|nr:aspartic peptidase domain-containing protein [Auriculariopsis ampla]